MIMTSPDADQVRRSGDRDVSKSANRAPATPEKPADMTNATSLYLFTFTPMKLDLSGFSLIVSSMSPKGDLVIRHKA